MKEAVFYLAAGILIAAWMIACWVWTKPISASTDSVGQYIQDGHLRHIQDQQTGYYYAYARPGDLSSTAIVTWIPCDQAERPE
jgi:hypothetical protein